MRVKCWICGGKGHIPVYELFCAASEAARACTNCGGKGVIDLEVIEEPETPKSPEELKEYVLRLKYKGCTYYFTEIDYDSPWAPAHFSEDIREAHFFKEVPEIEIPECVSLGFEKYHLEPGSEERDQFLISSTIAVIPCTRDITLQEVM